MKCSCDFEGVKKKKRRVVNVVELGDELVYIRLDDGKKYLLNSDGWSLRTKVALCFWKKRLRVLRSLKNGGWYKFALKCGSPGKTHHICMDLHLSW
jgi:hypothetical protein